MESKILTIMFTDMKDFTARTRIQSREENMILMERHEELIRPFISNFKGRIIKTLGDSFLAVFESPTNALLSAISIQKKLHEYNLKVSNPDQKIELRIGLAAGEVLCSESDIAGDPVNIAARVVAITEVNQVLFTETVYLTMNKSEIPHKFWGEKMFKGIPEPIKTYKVILFQDKTEKDMDNPGTLATGVKPTGFVTDIQPPSFEKLDRSELGEMFDFTNVEMEKELGEEHVNSNDSPAEDSSQETLEIDSSHTVFAKGVDPARKTGIKDSSREDSDPRLEHSKEILLSLRNEKKQKKFLVVKIIGSAFFLLAAMFGTYQYYMQLEEKKSRKAAQEELENSPVLQAIQEATKTPPPERSRAPLKPIESIDYGSVSITISPSAAEVYLNDELVSKKSPVVIKKLKPNQSNTLIIRKHGYKPYQLLFDLLPGETKDVDARLVPLN